MHVLGGSHVLSEGVPHSPEKKHSQGCFFFYVKKICRLPGLFLYLFHNQ